MKKLAWIGLGGLLLVMLMAALLFAAYLVFELPQEIGHVTVNGKVLDLHGAHAGHWLLATLVLLLAATIALVLVPTLALLGLIVPMSLAAFGLTVAVLVVALVLSPLGLLIWWLWKRGNKPGTMTP